MEENRLAKSMCHTASHTVGCATINTSLTQVLKWLKMRVLCGRI